MAKIDNAKEIVNAIPGYDKRIKTPRYWLLLWKNGHLFCVNHQKKFLRKKNNEKQKIEKDNFNHEKKKEKQKTQRELRPYESCTW